MATIAAGPVAKASNARLIDEFIPRADRGDLHEVLIRAPAEPVFSLAWSYDLRSHPLVRAIVRLRQLVMRGRAAPPRAPAGIVAETTGLGWVVLAHRPGREVVLGAATEPWKPDVVFRPVPRDEFAGFAEPGLVKIVWTLEARPLGPALTLFRTETRALATDPEARRRFCRYWLGVGLGVKLIRRLMVPAIRREAERRYRRKRNTAVLEGA
ncbi:MAG TPA: hypothetical protein VFN96_00035 [Gemmatimonadales bacterium]|nr:hypothetical protein [Gemmatimonadales bacterium]